MAKQPSMHVSSKDLGPKPSKLARQPTFARLESSKMRPMSMPAFQMEVDDSMQHDDIDEDHYLDGTQSERTATRSWSMSGGFREASFKKRSPENSLKKPGELKRTKSAVGFATVLTVSGWSEHGAEQLEFGLDGSVGTVDSPGHEEAGAPSALRIVAAGEIDARDEDEDEDETAKANSKSFKARRTPSADESGNPLTPVSALKAAANEHEERARAREREEMRAHQRQMRDAQLQQQQQISRLEVLLTATASHLQTLAAQPPLAHTPPPAPPAPPQAPPMVNAVSSPLSRVADSPLLVAPSPPLGRTLQQAVPPELPPVMWGVALGEACWCARDRRAAKARATPTSSSAFETPLLGGLLRFYHLSAS